MCVVHEKDVQEIDLPGRRMKVLVSPELMSSKFCQVCIIRVSAGESVKPAHAHPKGEEVIYIISGNGAVMIDGKIKKVEKGTTVFFPQNSQHILKNEGSEEMKVICFFAPPTSVDEYVLFDDVVF
jgi:mannose-6-phosphate isomerase-like protein (cupin superfamily)